MKIEYNTTAGIIYAKMGIMAELVFVKSELVRPNAGGLSRRLHNKHGKSASRGEVGQISTFLQMMTNNKQFVKDAFG